MKSYTDIEQSRKLAEILPIESADHHYVRKVTDFMGNSVDGEWSWPKYGNPNSKYANYMVQNFTSYEKIPCWSLAALLDVIPYATVNDDGEDLRLHIDKDCSGYYLFYENEYTGELHEIETDMYDDMIDACYEMILKLKEQNLL